ncbi:hypothetical protein GCM10010250_03690 [Streptomyces althioticus]|nr:response regulator transcription factor [Actinospica acidiphila]GGQ37221.1 hypothetical protein GCM10010250_03690 [Streptomyces althioticus]
MSTPRTSWSPTSACRRTTRTTACARRWPCAANTRACPSLVLSQYIEQSYAAQLLDLGSDRGVGYLLKDRVSAVSEFVDAVTRVAAGATVVDPEAVRPSSTAAETPCNASPHANARSSP